MLGHDPARRERAFLERIGIVLQEEGLDPNLNVGEAVALYSAAYPNPRPVDEVLELVGLAGRAGDRAATLSGGQRRRLDLALGIAGDPELLFLDEPTTGFDPSARRHAWELIGGLRELGKTILLTTHYMEEAQVLADRVVVLAGGRVIAEGTPDTLGGGGESIVSYRADGRVGRFTTTTPTRDLAPILCRAADRGEELEGLTVTRRQPRGRLPRAHRGPLHDRHPTSAPARPLDRGARAHDDALAARARLHVRVPARAGDAVRLAQRRPDGHRAVGCDVKFTQYYTPSIGVFALTLACYTSLIIGVATARETGLLKRVRGTPLPLPVYLGAWLIGAGSSGILSVVLLFVVAVPASACTSTPTCCRRRCWCSCSAPRASARSGSRSGRWRRPPTRRRRSRS